MKYIVNLFLVFYLVLKPLLTMMDYVVNYDYISKVVCMNKTKPELHCNGKCYLTKELSKTSQDDSSNSSKTKQTQKVIDLYIPVMIAKIQKEYRKSQLTITSAYQKNYAFLFLKYIFKPPII